MSALTATQIPCCLCGTLILPNAANQCPSCLAQGFNLQDRLQRGPGGADHSTVFQCRQCRRFQRTPKYYEHAEPESPELLAICLKHIPALQHSHQSSAAAPPLHLVEASWIWTEPHSMRFKLRLTVRTEIENVAVQQRCAVLLHCAFQMCPDCNREYTNRTWHAVVQLRQKRTDDAPKKGLAALEMALAQNPRVRKHVLRIDTATNGFDFYFLSVPHAQAFSAYLQRVAPMRVKTTHKLVSTDVKNNTANMKHTITCDVVPLCKDDLVLVHKQAKCKLAGRLVLVVTKPGAGVIHLMDASPKRENLNGSVMELSAEAYYKQEKHYTVLQSGHRMTRFVALDAELCSQVNLDGAGENNGGGGIYQGPSSGVDKYALADLEVARENDFGKNDDTFQTVTHLGNLVSVGDVVLGYDLVGTIGGDWELEESLHSNFVMPDVVLVKKMSGDAGKAKENEAKAVEEDSGAAKKRLSKRKERRRKKEGKRMRELEESAARMGFLEEGEEEEYEYDHAAMESELANDPEMVAEVSALERDFEALSASMPPVASADGGDEMGEDHPTQSDHPNGNKEAGRPPNV